MRFRKNVSLKNHTTFRIGGPAKYFFEAKTTKSLIEALRFAKRNKVPFFILGQGSNVLVSDKGFKGLIIKIQNSEFKIRNLRLNAEAGISISTLVRETGKRGLSGLEWAGGLPGTLGGAVFGNAGAFGGEMKDNVIWVEALDKKFKIRKLSKKQCQFKYRSSIFKKNDWTILSAEFLLKKGNKKRIQATASSHVKHRKKRNPLEYPSAGSVFKNYDVRRAPKKAVKIFKEVIKYDPFPVIPAAAIINKVPGLSGTKVRGAQVSKKHPNFIVNLGGAEAKDVLELIKLVKQKVKKKFGVDIKEEIRYIG